MKFLVSIIFLTIANLQTLPPLTVQGTVSDREGAAIGRAQIVVHWDSSGSQVGLKTNVGVGSDIKVTADASGRFSLNLPPGFYDMFVSSPAFSPACRKIRVVPRKTLNEAFQLDADPLVTRELGDTFK